MKKIKLFLILIGVLFVIKNTTAQKQSRSDEDYDRLEYKDAIKSYENEDSLSSERMVQIADIYRLNDNTESAVQWYAQVVAQDDCEPINYLHYAKALQTNGNLDLAKEYFLKYDKEIGFFKKDSRGLEQAAAISEGSELKQANATVTELFAINSAQLDFSPIYYKKGLLFVSTRKTKKRGSYQWTDGAFMKLFYASKSKEGSFGNPELFLGNWAKKFHQGPMTFTGDYERIYFTQNDFQKGRRKKNKEGIMKMGIFTAVRDGEAWTAPQPISINTIENDECHPSISSDGQLLFFASDKEGGYGGMDIYVSKFKNGSWSTPENLGPNVNTAGNEVFPYVDRKGKVFFSSDGKRGLGGLDLYYTTKKEEGWDVSQNMGQPFNSPKDDFGLSFAPDGETGFFSSSRKEGTGKDDIYHFVLTEETPIVVVEKKELESTKENENLTILKDESKDMTVPLDVESLTNKEKDSSSNISLNDFANKDIDDVSIGEVVELNYVFYDYDRYNINDLAAINLDVLVGVLKENTTMSIELSSHTDSRGKEKYNHKLSEKRALAAVQYLIENGIDRSRVQHVGYGELKLRNRCSDGVECSEKEHQFNRRTEVRVVQK